MKSALILKHFIVIAIAIINCNCVHGDNADNFRTDCNGVATDDEARAAAACEEVGGTGKFEFIPNRVIAGITVTVTICEMKSADQAQNVGCLARLCCRDKEPDTKELVTFAGANRYYLVDMNRGVLLSDRVVFFEVDESQQGNVGEVERRRYGQGGR